MHCEVGLNRKPLPHAQGTPLAGVPRPATEPVRVSSGTRWPTRRVNLAAMKWSRPGAALRGGSVAVLSVRLHRQEPPIDRRENAEPKSPPASRGRKALAAYRLVTENLEELRDPMRADRLAVRLPGPANVPAAERCRACMPGASRSRCGFARHPATS